MNHFDLTRSDKVIIAVAAVYVLSPIDIVPEVVAGPLGLTDDMAALIVVGLILVRGHRRAKKSKAAGSPHRDKQTDNASPAMT